MVVIDFSQRPAFEAELTAAGVDWPFHVYGGVLHGFSVPGTDPSRATGCAWEERADRRSWQAMLALFDELLSAETGMMRGG